MNRTTAEGSRIQSAETKCDENATQATTMPARAATIKYVHRRWCRTLMPASCLCCSLRRRAYSPSGVSFAVLVEASHSENSGVLMDTPSLSRPGSLILSNVEKQKSTPRKPRHALPIRGATTRKRVGGAERAGRDLVHLEPRWSSAIVPPIADRRPTGKNRLEAHGGRQSAICGYSLSEQRQTQAGRQARGKRPA